MVPLNLSSTSVQTPTATSTGGGMFDLHNSMPINIIGGIGFMGLLAIVAIAVYFLKNK